LPTSHGFVPLENEGRVIPNPLPPSDKPTFINQFEYTGALDNSPFLCVPDCFQFIDTECGGQRKYIEYCQTLSQDGGAIVASILGTEVMDNKEGTLSKCFFTNVRLPLQAHSFTAAERNRVTHWMTDHLVLNYHTFVVVYVHAEAWWVRLSAQIYLELSDYSWIARILNQICRQVMDKSFSNSSEL
jgi:hypothetical protein